MTAVDRIAAALEDHWLNPGTGECMSQDHETARRFFDGIDDHARHQAEVIAGLDGLAVVERTEADQ